MGPDLWEDSWLPSGVARSSGRTADVPGGGRTTKSRGSRTPLPQSPSLRISELNGRAREHAIPILKESFTGVYRWHAKRTLREIATVRGAKVGRDIVGVSLIENLLPEVGYDSYIFDGRATRRRGVGARLLDDAVGRFRRGTASVAYSVATNRASAGLLRSRGFRRVARRELGWREGGLGAWGLRSRMRIIAGEVLFGRRLDRSPGTGGPEKTTSVPPTRQGRRSLPPRRPPSRPMRTP